MNWVIVPVIPVAGGVNVKVGADGEAELVYLQTW